MDFVMDDFTTSSCHPGRLETVLDRSWETQSVTWTGLTWWDPLPCGSELLSQVTRPHLPLPLLSPSLSLLCHPPSPQYQDISSQSSISSSPTPVHSSYSSSPLAWPLPLSPDSYNSVFLPNSDSSPDFPSPPTPHPFPSPPNYYHNKCPSLSQSRDSLPKPGIQSTIPTPPLSSGRRPPLPPPIQCRTSRRIFHFPLPRSVPHTQHLSFSARPSTPPSHGFISPCYEDKYRGSRPLNRPPTS